MCSPDTGWVGTQYRLSDTISAVVHSTACSPAVFWDRHLARARVACSSLAENRRSSLVTLQDVAIGVTRPEGRREAGNWTEGASVGRPAGKDVSYTVSRRGWAGSICEHTLQFLLPSIVLLLGLHSTLVAVQAVDAMVRDEGLRK